MTYGLLAVAITWALIFGLLQASKPFAGVVYKAGEAPPWPSRALTAGSAVGFAACIVGMAYRRSNEFFGEELAGIAIVVLAGGLCVIANRLFFKRWW